MFIENLLTLHTMILKLLVKKLRSPFPVLEGVVGRDPREKNSPCSPVTTIPLTARY